MPPVTPRDSRAGLVSAVVVLSILFATALVFAIYCNAQWRTGQEEMRNYKARYTDILSEQSLSGQDVLELKNLRTDASATTLFNLTPSMKAFEVLLAERNQLARTINGADSAAPAAVDAAQRKLAEVEGRLKAAGLALPSASENLVAAVGALADAVASRQGQIGDLQKQLMDAKAQVAATEKRTAETLAAKDKLVAQAREQAQKDTAAAAADRSAKQQQANELTQQASAIAKSGADAVAQKDAELRDKLNEIKKTQQALDAVRAKLEGHRLNVNDPVIRHADGIITKIASENIVYINRGMTDQIVRGLTFEVYDKVSGIPSLGAGTADENMPVGKASLEVINVGPTSSECRIVRQQYATTLTQGDLIANLVYDPNTRYSFVVYGKFNLDQKQGPTLQDADVLKRLVTQWGARVVEKVGVDVDFVVLGTEPTLPNYSSDDLQDPINKKKLDDAQAELDAYGAVLQEAKELHIPVLNQNRFLYFVGYYDLAQR